MRSAVFIKFLPAKAAQCRSYRGYDHLQNSQPVKCHAGRYARHRDLLRLRREDPVFRAPRRGGLDGAVLGPEALVLRFFGTSGDDRLLLVNLGRDLHLYLAPEPLLAPHEGRRWQLLWSSEDPTYEGGGTAPLEDEEHWHIPGHAAVVLQPAAGEK
jgi:maltooligosyltrehalose trehalohydrolase